MMLTWLLLACAPEPRASLPTDPPPRPDFPIAPDRAPLPGPDPGAVLARESCDRYVAAAFAERNFLPGQAPPPGAPKLVVGGPGIVAAPGTPQVPMGPAPRGTPVAAAMPPPSEVQRIAPDCSLLGQ